MTAEPGARLSVLAEAAGHTAELVVLVVRHRSSGWVREIARKDEDYETDATFDPENGVVSVYEGRREFKALLKSLPATKIIATHDLEMVLELCPRAIVIDAGQLVAQGPTAQLLADEPLMLAHGLETPGSLRPH